MPEAAHLLLDGGDLRFTAAPAQEATVRELPAAAWIKGRLLEHDSARPRIHTAVSSVSVSGCS